MPMFKIAAGVLAASAFVVATASVANDVDPTVEAAPVPTHNLFTSWFGGRAARTEVAPTEPTPSFEELAAPAAPGKSFRAADLVVNALGLLGISYRLGGNTPASGFDCSGMVRYVFQNALGLDLPRRAEEISRIGTHVDRTELKPGDLVFYKTLRKTFSHVGIYLGNNRFIHAPSAGGAVRVDDMGQSYWAARFNGARRVAS